MEKEARKRNSDCLYFMASPNTCKKGSECDYRHCESARRNPMDCVYWLSAKCNNPTCAFRHPAETQIRHLYGFNGAIPNLTIYVASNFEDPARSEEEIRQVEKSGEKLIHVNQDTRFNTGVLDARTPTNNAIVRLQSSIKSIFENFLHSEGFVGIHTPHLIDGASEGDASVFKLDYYGQPAWLAQSPQYEKQIAMCAGFERIYEIGSVLRAEDSYTHRLLCEFTGLDVEMDINEHYFEVSDIVDRLFVTMFDYLNEKCKTLLEIINRQYPFKPLKYLRKTLLLTFEDGVKMLKDAGVEVDSFEDLNTEAKRTLGRLVLEKYETDFYILHRYPLAIRPFYTMPCYDNPLYSNSFVGFIRGEEIISGAQTVHTPDLLTTQAEVRGIDVNKISGYVNLMRNFGRCPHGGFGLVLERVVLLFCCLSDILQLFPCDLQRLVP